MEKLKEKETDNHSLEHPKRLIENLKLIGSKYENIQESRSILAVYEQRLFVWHTDNSCVLSFELVDGKVTESTECDVLLPSNPPVFEIECLLFNRTGTLLAMVGHKGVMLMHVPWMHPSQKKSNPVFCQSWNIAERFFICTSQVDVLQASWHPGSNTCAHIVVLSSDNYLRLYDANDAQTPIHAVQLGPSNSMLSAKHKVSFSACLGESAVCFDFGPPESISQHAVVKRVNFDDEDFIYPVYILYANGDVCVVKMPTKKINALPVKVEGPLAMYPAAEDNYGVDACSMICLHSNPSVLVIAMASGIVYHCLLLESSSDEDKLSKDFLPDSCISDCSISLYVQGSIELPVSPLEDTEVYFQPIRLYKDIVSCYKYHCALVCGVHTVVIPFIQKIEEFAEKEDIDTILSQSHYNDSIVEHLLCTKPLPAVKAIPVIGIASVVVETGVILVCLLASWEFTCIPLLSNFQSSVAPLLSSVKTFTESENDVSKQENFANQIQQLLHRSTSIPVLKTHDVAAEKNVTTSRQHLELLWNCTNRFREEYIDPLSTAHVLLAHRFGVLVNHKQQQLRELERHLKEKDELRYKAEQLAEKYEDAHANQQLLLERTEKVMRLLQQRFPVLSTAEIGMKNDLIAMEEKLKLFQFSLDQLKKKWGQQNKKIDEQESSKDVETLQMKMENLNIGKTQLKHIREILHQEGDSIAKLVRSVVSLRKEVGT